MKMRIEFEMDELFPRTCAEIIFDDIVSGLLNKETSGDIMSVTSEKRKIGQWAIEE